MRDDIEALRNICNQVMDDEPRKQAIAALERLIAELDRAEEKVRHAFMAGFWAWNGPSNEVELARDIGMEADAWKEYSIAELSDDAPAQQTQISDDT